MSNDKAFDKELAMEYMRHGSRVADSPYVREIVDVIMANLATAEHHNAAIPFDIIFIQIQQLVQITAQLSRANTEGVDLKKIMPPEGPEREALHERQRAIVTEMTKHTVNFIEPEDIPEDE